jgi:hypothetical protein
LDEPRARANFFERIIRAHDAADADDKRVMWGAKLRDEG